MTRNDTLCTPISVGIVYAGFLRYTAVNLGFPRLSRVLMSKQGGVMAKPIRATPVVKGKAADRIIQEMRNGTPNTAKRIETITRADRIYSQSQSKSQQRSGS